MHGNKTLYPIWIIFCRMVDIPDLITYANFGDDSEVAGNKFWLFLA